MIRFEKAGMRGMTSNVLVDPSEIKTAYEDEVRFDKNETWEPVVRIYFRTGGDMIVKDPDRSVLDQIERNHKWGDIEV